ncbi:MAG TPA: type III pantothenate kinase [Gammaproteobacteria bacterium]|nr:type III pantothenate kinase [Gammaproteobacteria bacterium]
MLLVDLGNSRIKWGQLVNGELQQVSSAVWRTDLVACLDEHWSALSPDTIALLSVADAATTGQLINWCTQHWQQTPQQYYSTAAAAGVTNAYANPAQLGADRWAGMIAAYNIYHGPVCVVDAGTAVTLDVVDAQGQHSGGLILPGAAALWQSVRGTTARVLTDADEKLLPPPDTVLGATTQQCAAAGIWHAIAGGVERAVQQLPSQTRNYILTGGSAPVLAKLLDAQWRQVPDLVLRGLAILANKQQR